jgi:hypothetical protein
MAWDHRAVPADETRRPEGKNPQGIVREDDDWSSRSVKESFRDHRTTAFETGHRKALGVGVRCVNSFRDSLKESCPGLRPLADRASRNGTLEGSSAVGVAPPSTPVG